MIMITPENYERIIAEQLRIKAESERIQTLHWSTTGRILHDLLIRDGMHYLVIDIIDMSKTFLGLSKSKTIHTGSVIDVPCWKPLVKARDPRGK